MKKLVFFVLVLLTMTLLFSCDTTANTESIDESLDTSKDIDESLDTSKDIDESLDTSKDTDESLDTSKENVT